MFYHLATRRYLNSWVSTVLKHVNSLIAFVVSYVRRDSSLRAHSNAYVTVFWKTDHLRTRTEIHVLPVHDRHTHALSRNTKHWTIDSQVCFYRRLFIDSLKPRGCISWPWGASIGLHGVRGCSSRQSWPPLYIVIVCATDRRHSTAFESDWLL